ncbi:MAG: PTS sugar transporter subunit IIA, partial [Planctomycetota bacterium]
MALADYLRSDAVCMDLAAQKRDEAIRALLDQFVDHNVMPAGLAERALAAILDRERLGSTAIGKGVAVPHARVDDLDQVMIAFGYSSGGVEFKSLDGQ